MGEPVSANFPDLKNCASQREGFTTFSESKVQITGATSGLGLALSKGFAGLDASTILLNCNPEARAVTIAEIEKDAPQASIRTMICDLSSMTSIEKFHVPAPHDADLAELAKDLARY
jgi:NAD(P)-dependent dehydrogenase (short-subunit alcohol dehydrogenase family)